MSTSNGVNNQEIEVRFLEIDALKLKQRLLELGAEDLGEDIFSEMIFYHDQPGWDYYHRGVLKIRKTKDHTEFTYKRHHSESVDGTFEATTQVSDSEKTRELVEALGFPLFREQEKRRHTFKLGQVSVDIDTWPKVPTYVELEGPDETSLKQTAAVLGLDWAKAIFENPLMVIEKYYHIPVGGYRYFTFERMG
ncbi:MAG: class IV adenylate cyclase [Patescibacteria group bacterium]|nr:class IV adenylate cyclase [Patescibacteria group bacterium]